MSTEHLTPFSRFLARADEFSAEDLSRHWVDQTVHFVLTSDRPIDPVAVGPHLRRSFLGALGPGGSDLARRSEPCDWDPPCALDIFCREQLRGPRGDGMPKPYLVYATSCGKILQVSLRVFGVANDWFPTATEAMGAGLRDILPWQKRLGVPQPTLISRQIDMFQSFEVPADTSTLVLEFESPADISGKSESQNLGRSLIGRLLRRVDALARWQGAKFSDSELRRLTASLDKLDYDLVGLRSGRVSSPNIQKQDRTRSVLTGRLTLRGELSAIRPVLQIGERCSVGRGAVEGLGRFRIAS